MSSYGVAGSAHSWPSKPACEKEYRRAVDASGIYAACHVRSARLATPDRRYLLLYWLDSDGRKRWSLHDRLKSLMRRGAALEKPRRGVLIGDRESVVQAAYLLRELGVKFRVFRVESEVDVLGEEDVESARAVPGRA
jgi:hypothetical protein